MNSVVARVRDFAEGAALVDAMRSMYGWAKFCVDDNCLEVRTDVSNNLDVIRSFAHGFLHRYRRQ